MDRYSELHWKVLKVNGLCFLTWMGMVKKNSQSLFSDKNITCPYGFG